MYSTRTYKDSCSFHVWLFQMCGAACVFSCGLACSLLRAFPRYPAWPRLLCLPLFPCVAHLHIVLLCFKILVSQYCNVLSLKGCLENRSSQGFVFIFCLKPRNDCIYQLGSTLEALFSFIYRLVFVSPTGIHTQHLGHVHIGHPGVL